MEPDLLYVIQSMAQQIINELQLGDIKVETINDLYALFTPEVLQKPLILIVDEFDAINQEAITKIVSVLGHIYLQRQRQANVPTREKGFLLHGVALIGVRAVLEVENVTGSPFNVQRSLNIPNLTLDEVHGMFPIMNMNTGNTSKSRWWNGFFMKPKANLVWSVGSANF